MDDATLLVTVLLASTGFLPEADAVATLCRAGRAEEQLWSSPLKNYGIGPNGRTRFAAACARGDLERVRFMHEQNVDANQASGVNDVFFEEFELSPIELAAVNGHVAVVSFLGSSPRINDLSAVRSAAAVGLSDLIAAIYARNSALNTLLDDEEDEQADDGNPFYPSAPLLWATRSGCISVIEDLIGYCPKHLGFYARCLTASGTHSVMSALDIAAACNDQTRVEMVELLIRIAKAYGILADVIEGWEDVDKTALSFAWSSAGSWSTRLEVVKLLLDAGAMNMNTLVVRPARLHAPPTLLWWLLEGAKEARNAHDRLLLERFERLLPVLFERGADVDALRPVTVGSAVRELPADFAIRHGFSCDVVRSLLVPLRFGEDADVPKLRTSSLLLACSMNRVDVVRAILDGNSAPVDIPQGNETPLHAASAHTEAIETILSDWKERRVRAALAPAESPLETRYKEMTPLLACVAAANWRGAAALLREGARPTSMHVSSGLTALHIACLGADISTDAVDDNARIDLIGLLLEKGADPQATTNRRNETALHFAALYNDSAAVRCLLSHKTIRDPDVNARAFSYDITRAPQFNLQTRKLSIVGFCDVMPLMRTPLMYAALYDGSRSCLCATIDDLLASGASTAMLDANSKSAANIAGEAAPGKICVDAVKALYARDDALIRRLIAASARLLKSNEGSSGIVSLASIDEAFSLLDIAQRAKILNGWVTDSSQVHACLFGDPASSVDADTLKALLSCGLDPRGLLSAVCDADLDSAESGEPDACLDVILELGLKDAAFAADYTADKIPPLLRAARRNNTYAITTLLQDYWIVARHSIDAVDEDGRSAADWALEHARREHSFDILRDDYVASMKAAWEDPQNWPAGCPNPNPFIFILDSSNLLIDATRYALEATGWVALVERGAGVRDHF